MIYWQQSRKVSQSDTNWIIADNFIIISYSIAHLVLYKFITIQMIEILKFQFLQIIRLHLAGKQK